MPWRAVLGVLVGAVQVCACLTQIDKVGEGRFMGGAVIAALITSLVINPLSTMIAESDFKEA
jgi:hypothetical protein